MRKLATLLFLIISTMTTRAQDTTPIINAPEDLESWYVGMVWSDQSKTNLLLALNGSTFSEVFTPDKWTSNEQIILENYINWQDETGKVPYGIVENGQFRGTDLGNEYYMSYIFFDNKELVNGTKWKIYMTEKIGELDLTGDNLVMEGVLGSNLIHRYKFVTPITSPSDLNGWYVRLYLNGNNVEDVKNNVTHFINNFDHLDLSEWTMEYAKNFENILLWDKNKRIVEDCKFEGYFDIENQYKAFIFVNNEHFVEGAQWRIYITDEYGSCRLTEENLYLQGVLGNGFIPNGSNVITIPSSGYTTFCNKTDVVIPEGVTAYKATNISGNIVNLELITDKIPASTGVIIKGTANQQYIFSSTTGAKPVENNLLVASNEFSTIKAGKYVFNDGKFNPLTEDCFVEDSNVYLNCESNEDNLIINFKNIPNISDIYDIVGISENYIKKPTISYKNYNLSGQEVKPNYRGIIIRNNKKIYMK